MLKIKQKAKKFSDIQHGVFGAFGVQQALSLPVSAKAAVPRDGSLFCNVFLMRAP